MHLVALAVGALQDAQTAILDSSVDQVVHQEELLRHVAGSAYAGQHLVSKPNESTRSLDFDTASPLNRRSLIVG